MKRNKAEAPSFDSKRAWISSPTPEPSKLLAAIVDFLPKESFLYVEGTVIDSQASALYCRNACSPVRKIVPDTIQPPPRSFHMPATVKVLTQLSTFMKANPSAKWGHHLKIYSAEGILVDWHDADTDWPVFLSSRFSKKSAEELGRILGCTFTR